MENIIGNQYNRLTVIRYFGQGKNNEILWECLCNCGNVTTSTAYRLKSGKKKSCGCFYREERGKPNITHGKSKKGGAYNSWCGMKQRCYYKKNISYHNYGGRGIKVCDRWIGEDGFKNFLEDMGERPSNKHSLDRYPNVNGDYCKQNCRWASREQQAKGMRSNVIIEYKNEKYILVELAKKFNINSTTLKRHFKNKTIEQALDYCVSFTKKRVNRIEYNGDIKSVKALTQMIGIHSSTFRKHLKTKTIQDIMENYKFRKNVKQRNWEGKKW